MLKEFTEEDVKYIIKKNERLEKKLESALAMGKITAEELKKRKVEISKYNLELISARKKIKSLEKELRLIRMEVYQQ